MHIHFLDDGVERFIRSLERQTIAKTLRVLDLLEKFGNALGMPHSKPIAHQLFELRIRGSQEVRLLYTFHKGGIVVLHGFIKKSERIPQKELRQAQEKKRLLDK